MPPQTNSQPTPPQDSGANATHSAFSFESLKKNPKFIQTLKVFTIYGTITAVANALVAFVLHILSWSQYYYGVSGGLIGAVIGGVIGGIIAGVLFFFFYEPVHNWVKRNHFLSKYIHDMFTLFWKPFLVVSVITAAAALLGMIGLSTAMVPYAGGYVAIGFGSLFIGWLVTFAAHVAIYYWYSRQISAKLSLLYPW